MKNTIIAIDPGTRFLGVTIFSEGRIVLAGVKTLGTGNSRKKKLARVGKIFLSMVENSEADILVLEKPQVFWIRQSRLLDAVINEIKRLAREKNLRIYEFSPLTVRKTICGDASATKRDLADIVCRAYPDLKRLDQERPSRKLYWSRSFDSQAVGLCYLKKRREILSLPRI